MSVVCNEIIFFEKDDPIYQKFITKDDDYPDCTHSKLNRKYLDDILLKYTHGYIYIEKKINHFKSLPVDEQRQLMGDISESSSEDDDHEFTVYGFLLFTEIDDDDFNTFSVNLDFLCASFSRRGLGMAMVNLLIEHCNEYAIPLIKTQPVDHTLIPYYEKFGFILTLDNFNCSIQKNDIEMTLIL
jgi:GNAT superfamily N-acetyltransferase